MAWRFDPEKIERQRLEREARIVAELDDSPLSDGLCYFIGCDVDQDSPIVKIGFSIAVRRRFRQLKSNAGLCKLTMLATARGGRAREMHYHRQFAVHRCGGEWFRLHADIVAEIAALNSIPSPTHPGRLA